jgi:hypothetical protein
LVPIRGSNDVEENAKADKTTNCKADPDTNEIQAPRKPKEAGQRQSKPIVRHEVDHYRNKLKRKVHHDKPQHTCGHHLPSLASKNAFANTIHAVKELHGNHEQNNTRNFSREDMSIIC